MSDEYRWQRVVTAELRELSKRSEMEAREGAREMQQRIKRIWSIAENRRALFLYRAWLYADEAACAEWGRKVAQIKPIPNRAERGA